MPRTIAVHAPPSASLPLIQAVARAAAAVLDPALSVNSILDVVAEQARELVGAARASVSLSATDESGRKTDLHQTIADHTGRPVGEIRLAGKPGGQFSAADEEIVRQVAQLASVAIHNAQIRTLLRQSEERLRRTVDEGREQIRRAALNADIGLALARGVTIREMLQHVAKAIVQKVGEWARS